MNAKPAYAARMKAPFAVLGIRTAGGAVTGIEFLPRSERAQAPADTVAERAVRELERWLDDPQFRFTVSARAAGHRISPARLAGADQDSGRRIAYLRRTGAPAAHRAPRGRRRLRRKRDRRDRAVPPGRRQPGFARRFHGRHRRRSDRHQALAARARGLPLRRVTTDGSLSTSVSPMLANSRWKKRPPL